jgi:hypothetical protein
MLTTESSSNYHDLEKMNVQDILTSINNEDQTVPNAVQRSIPQIEALVEQIVPAHEKRWPSILHRCRYQWKIGSGRRIRMPADIRRTF